MFENPCKTVPAPSNKALPAWAKGLDSRFSSPQKSLSMVPTIAFSLIESGLHLSLFCGFIALVSAFFLIRVVIAASPGNERMIQIASAIEEGAKAYLKRQVATISVIAIAIFVLLLIFKDTATAVGFVVGATCSLAAGYIGMRIAVLANTRTAQAATKSRHAALRIAFNGGAVTGLLVVGLALLAVGLFYLGAERMIGPRAGSEKPGGAGAWLQPDQRVCAAGGRDLYEGGGCGRGSGGETGEQSG